MAGHNILPCLQLIQKYLSSDSTLFWLFCFSVTGLACQRYRLWSCRLRYPAPLPTGLLQSTGEIQYNIIIMSKKGRRVFLVVGPLRLSPLPLESYWFIFFRQLFPLMKKKWCYGQWLGGFTSPLSQWSDHLKTHFFMCVFPKGRSEFCLVEPLRETEMVKERLN